MIQPLHQPSHIQRTYHIQDCRQQLIDILFNIITETTASMSHKKLINIAVRRLTSEPHIWHQD
ncbi:hypothetical protein DSUL_50146 [Desulfovibrionales bacterium]